MAVAVRNSEAYGEGTKILAQRRTVGKGDFSFPEIKSSIGDRIFALLSLPFSLPFIVLFSLKNKGFKNLEYTILNTVLESLDDETAGFIRRKQLGVAATAQGTYLENSAETILRQWSPLGMAYAKKRTPPIANLNCEASILATIRFRVQGSEFVADLLCARGVLTFIEFNGDIYDVRHERDIEVIDIDTEPVEINRNGDFVRSLA